MGGERIAQLEAEKRDAGTARDERLRKKGQVQRDFQKLGWPMPQAPAALAEATAKARQEIEAWQEQRDQTRQKQFALSSQRVQAEKEFAAAVKEVQALRRQPSNIPADQLELRGRSPRYWGSRIPRSRSREN